MVPIAEPERHRTRTAAADLVPLRGPRRSPRSRHTMARSKHAVLRPRRVARHPDRRCSHAPVLDAEPVRPGHIASRRPALSKGILIPLTFEASPWGRKYPAIGQSWRRAWAEVVPFYAFHPDVRRLVYTTNAIEALNSKLRTAIRARGHFPTDEAAMKLLFLVLNRSEKEWTMPAREWCMAKAQFAVMFGERFSKAAA